MYDGTNYAGWQVQPTQITVQSSLEAAVEKLCGINTRVFGSGRTDAGVHAKGQVFHVDIPTKFNESKFVQGINSYLASDIRVCRAVIVKDDFDARFSARRKEYRYFISTADVADPEKRLYRYHLGADVDLEAMRKSASLLIGEHDFVSFAANRNQPEKTTVRTIYSLDVSKRGTDVCLKVSGNGFLYKMVRSLAGHLVEVGQGKRNLRDTKEILSAKKRTRLVVTAPAQGLFLWKVSY